MNICPITTIDKYCAKKQQKDLYVFHDFLNIKSLSSSLISNRSKFQNHFSNWNFYSIFVSVFTLPLMKYWQSSRQYFLYEIKNFISEKGNLLADIDSFFFLLINMKSLQKKFLPNSNYMKYQTDITAKMRTILIDWLIDVHIKFKLAYKTLYLTINIIDRFLSIKKLARQRLQLLGITAMLVASKYEEIYAPETKDFVYISANAYTKDDIFKMEALVCDTLKFEFSCPSLFCFLIYFAKITNVKKNALYISLYLSELTMLDICMLRYSPSSISFSIVLLVSNFFSDEEMSFDQIKMLSRKKIHLENFIILHDCINVLKSLLILGQNDKQKIGSIRRKYGAKKFGEIAFSGFTVTVL